MAGQLAVLQAAELNAGLVRVGELGLEFLRRPTLEQWAGLAEYVGQVVRWSPFAIGDLIVAAEEFLGEEWAQYVSEDEFHSSLGVSGRTARAHAKVCRRLPLGERVVGLPFSQHALIVGATGPGERRDGLLEQAAREEWTVEELKRRLNGGEPVSELERALGRLEKAVRFGRENLVGDDLIEFNRTLTAAAWWSKS